MSSFPFKKVTVDAEDWRIIRKHQKRIQTQTGILLTPWMIVRLLASEAERKESLEAKWPIYWEAAVQRCRNA